MPRPRWALLSIGAACATVALKYTAFRLTGSVGILSDALESLVNVAAALVLLLTLWFAAFPPDRSHPYGHEKIEFLAAGFEGALIIIAAAGIVFEALPRLLTPAPVAQLGPGVALILLAAVINLVIARVLIAHGTRLRSLALESDGRHLQTDVVTTLGVTAGLGAVALSGWALLDPLIALGVAAHIVRTGVGLVRRSIHGLMDRALDPPEIDNIRAAIARHLRGGMDYHDLRTRRVGPRRLADVHLLVPGELSVREGHALATSVERAVHAALPGAELTVHVEPVEGDRGPGHDPADAQAARLS